MTWAIFKIQIKEAPKESFQSRGDCNLMAWASKSEFQKQIFDQKQTKRLLGGMTFTHWFHERSWSTCNSLNKYSLSIYSVPSRAVGLRYTVPDRVGNKRKKTFVSPASVGWKRSHIRWHCEECPGMSSHAYGGERGQRLALQIGEGSDSPAYPAASACEKHPLNWSLTFRNEQSI